MCIADGGPGTQAILKCGEVDEGFEDGADGAPSLQGAIILRFAGIASTDESQDGSGVIFDDHDGTLKVLRISLSVPSRSFLVAVSRVILDVTKAFLDCLFSELLKVGVECCRDDEPAVADVFLLKNPFQIPSDGIEGIAALGQAVGGSGDGELGGSNFVGDRFFDEAIVNHAVEHGIAFDLGLVQESEWGEGIGGANDPGEHSGFGEGKVFGLFVEIGF